MRYVCTQLAMLLGIKKFMWGCLFNLNFEIDWSWANLNIYLLGVCLSKQTNTWLFLVLLKWSYNSIEITVASMYVLNYKSI